MEDQLLFDGWRIWFLIKIKSRILSESGYRELPTGILLQELDFPTDDSKFWKSNKEAKFCKEFSKICQQFGFNPNNKADYDLHERNDEEGFDWTPNSGELNPEFAKICYAMYFKLLNCRRRIQKDLDHSLVFAKTARKVKLPQDISERIFYILSRFKGNSKSLNLVRDYFKPRGEFQADCISLVNELKKLEIENNLESEKSKIEVRIPKFISQLSLARGDGASTQWANHWKQELVKSLSKQISKAALLNKCELEIAEYLSRNEK
jgi:hypothetical protein